MTNTSAPWRIPLALHHREPSLSFPKGGGVVPVSGMWLRTVAFFMSNRLETWWWWILDLTAGTVLEYAALVCAEVKIFALTRWQRWGWIWKRHSREFICGLGWGGRMVCTHQSHHVKWDHSRECAAPRWRAGHSFPGRDADCVPGLDWYMTKWSHKAIKFKFIPLT